MRKAIQNYLLRLFYFTFYFGKPPWDTGISPPELMAFIASHPPGRALDLGCGTGTNAITLAQHDWQVTAVDFIGRAIRTAHRKAHNAGVEIDFRQEDVARLENVQGPFDLILDIGCFHSLSEADKNAYIKNLERLLATDGVFLMYAYFRLPDESATRLSRGLLDTDLERFDEYLNLVERQDGSERGLRPSAWFTYFKDNSSTSELNKTED